jgi:hypothetical protein
MCPREACRFKLATFAAQSDALPAAQARILLKFPCGAGAQASAVSLLVDAEPLQFGIELAVSAHTEAAHGGVTNNGDEDEPRPWQ